MCCLNNFVTEIVTEVKGAHLVSSALFNACPFLSGPQSPPFDFRSTILIGYQRYVLPVMTSLLYCSGGLDDRAEMFNPLLQASWHFVLLSHPQLANLVTEMNAATLQKPQVRCRHSVSRREATCPLLPENRHSYHWARSVAACFPWGFQKYPFFLQQSSYERALHCGNYLSVYHAVSCISDNICLVCEFLVAG